MEEWSQTDERPICHVARLNSDCLSEIFLHLAVLPLVDPPKFTNNVKDAKNSTSHPTFMDITAQSHQNLHLLTCCLVSRQWYETAQRLLWHTIVVRMRDQDAWYERLSITSPNNSTSDSGPVYSSSFGPGKWVRNLTIVGGNAKITSNEGELPSILTQNYHMLKLFPCLQELTIFGMGWGTSGMFTSDQLDALVTAGALVNIRKLTITATSEYLLKGAPIGRNWTELMGLLVHLPNLQHLSLQGFTYRGQLTTEQKEQIPTFQLVELKVQNCQLNYESFEWLVAGSLETLKALDMSNTSVWKVHTVTPIVFTMEKEGKEERRREKDQDQTLVPAKRMEAMEKRLGVDLPIFEIRRKS